MPAQVATVELWNKLQPLAGAAKFCADVHWSQCVETNREDGADQVQLTFPLAQTDAAAVTATTDMTTTNVVRIIHADGALTDYLVTIVTATLETDTVHVTGIGARAVLAAYTVTNATIPTPQNLGGILASYLLPPAWVTAGTFGQGSTTAAIVLSGDTVLTALIKVVAEVQATLSNGTAPCVMSFVPTVVSNAVTGYVVNILTTVAAGTVHFLEGKNLAGLTVHQDASQVAAPVTGYVLTIDDVYRNDPASYPLDKISVYQTCRLTSLTFNLDTTALRIVEVVTDHGSSIGSTVQVGTAVRRITQAVVTQAATQVAANTPSPVLTVSAGAMTTTTQAYVASAVNPQNAADHGTLTVLLNGTTGTASSSGAIANGTPLTLVNGETVTITRAAFGSSPVTATFKNTLSAGGSTTVQRTVTNQDLVPSTALPTLTVKPTVTATQYSIAYTNVGTLTRSIDGATAATPGASPEVVTRNAAGGAPINYTYYCANGGQTITAHVAIPPQDGGASVCVVTSLTAVRTSSTNIIVLTWITSNPPSGGSYAVDYTDNASSATVGSGTVSGITSAYSFNTATQDGVGLVNKGTANEVAVSFSFTLRAKDSGGANVATAAASWSGWYLP